MIEERIDGDYHGQKITQIFGEEYRAEWNGQQFTTLAAALAAAKTASVTDFAAVENGIHQLHRMAVTGEPDDSSAAEAVRDATDTPWENLTPSEQGQLQQLSEELRQSEPSPPPDVSASSASQRRAKRFPAAQ